MFVIPAFVLSSLVIVLLNRPIVMLLFGEEYVDNSTVLIPLSMWFVFSIVNNFLGVQILVASGHQKEYSNAFMISAVASIVMYFVLGKMIGIYGIAYATFLAEVLLTVLLIYKVKELL